MKRICSIIIAILLVASYFSIADASSMNPITNQISVFEPKRMMDAYNSSIASFFDVIADGKNHKALDEQFEVKLHSETDGEVVYENKDGAIVITFYSTDKDTKATKMTFWTSSESEYKNIPQLAFGWAIAMNYADGVIGLDFFEWLNGAQDGDVYKSEPYNATYTINEKYTSFTLVPN